VTPKRTDWGAVHVYDCARSYIEAHKAGWRDGDRSEQQWSSSIATYINPVFGDAPVADVDTAAVLRVIEPIWASKPETARRLRGRVESILDWATARGYRQGDNPARWRGHLANLLPLRTKVTGVEHHPALPYRELAAFTANLGKNESIAAAALDFTVLTAARTGEVIGARWAEIDLEQRLWTVPAGRIKAGREHRVPLSDAAMRILEKTAATRQNDFVFPGNKGRGGLSHMAMLRVLKRMGRSPCTVFEAASATGLRSRPTSRARPLRWHSLTPLATGSRPPTAGAICSRCGAG
jgi:integrase